MGSLEQNFLTAIIMVANFRPSRIEALQVALLLIGVQGIEFSAADVAVIANGDIHLPGCACGSLLAMGLAECTGRIKSPMPKAHGRKLNTYRIPAAKIPTARTWLREHGVERIPQLQGQMELGLALAVGQ